VKSPRKKKIETATAEVKNFWARHDGVWCVAVPRELTEVVDLIVTRKDGTTSRVAVDGGHAPLHSFKLNGVEYFVHPLFDPRDHDDRSYGTAWEHYGDRIWGDS
jgi:hypothetical protein